MRAGAGTLAALARGFATVPLGAGAGAFSTLTRFGGGGGGAGEAGSALTRLAVPPPPLPPPPPRSPFFCSPGTKAVVRPPTSMKLMRCPSTVAPVVVPHRVWKIQLRG